MLEKKMVAILVGTVVVVGGLIYWGMKDNSNNEPQVADDPSAIVYYYGEGCPHCKVVNDFLEANPQVKEKVTFEKKEVWSNKQNAAEMERRAKTCNIGSDSLGVPFLYGGDGKCYEGQVDVVNFFKEKSGVSADTPTETQN